MDRASKKVLLRFSRYSFIFLAILLATGFISIIAFHLSGHQIYTIVGRSMEPTLDANSTLILAAQDKPEVDHIVFFPKPKQWEQIPTDTLVESDTLVKRIKALSGDELAFDGNFFTVNGEEIFSVEETGYPCLDAPQTYTHILTEDEVFVLGDNYNASLDSRNIFCSGSKDFYVERKTLFKYGKIVWNF